MDTFEPRASIQGYTLVPDATSVRAARHVAPQFGDSLNRTRSVVPSTSSHTATRCPLPALATTVKLAVVSPIEAGPTTVLVKVSPLLVDTAKFTPPSEVA